MPTVSADRLECLLPDEIPVLRWTYARDGEVAQCELALTNDLSAYELRISPARLLDARPAESFDDALSAFRQQERVEQALLDQGWRLDRFERDRQPR